MNKLIPLGTSHGVGKLPMKMESASSTVTSYCDETNPSLTMSGASNNNTNESIVDDTSRSNSPTSNHSSCSNGAYNGNGSPSSENKYGHQCYDF